MSQDSMLVYPLAVTAAVLAAFSAAEPTGTPIWDTVLIVGLTAVTVAAASRAPRWATIVMATIASALAGITFWGLVAGVSLLVGLYSTTSQRRNRVTGALVAALAMQALMRLPAGGFFGMQSIGAGIAIVLVWWAGYRYADHAARQAARTAIAVLTIATMAILFLGGISLLNARNDVDRGVAAARRGLTAARSGEASTVVSELAVAERALQGAGSRIDGFPAVAMRLVPVASQHHRSIQSVLEQGIVVAQEASAAVEEANLDSMSLSAGAVDLQVLVDAAPRLRSTSNALEKASREIDAADSPWLLSQVRSRISQLDQEIKELQPETELAALAAESLPTMLGGDAPQTYFVMFGTPAESREFGGLLGSWALVTFDEGRLQLGDSGRVLELYELAGSNELARDAISPWFEDISRPTQFPQNLTGSPSFAEVSEATRQILDGIAGEQQIAGIVYLDAWALVAMLELTGEVATPYYPEPLDQTNGADFFFNTQYRVDASERTRLFDGLAEIANTVLDELSTDTLPGPEQLGRVLGPAARGGRLQVITFDEQHNAFLRQVKLLRDFRSPTTTDFVGLIQANALSNKMDLYLHRSLDYEVTISDGGDIEAQLTVELESLVPSDADEFVLGQGQFRGENHLLLSLYTPHVLQSVLVNGQSVEYRSTEEFGLDRYLIEIAVPPNVEPQVIQFELIGIMLADRPYSLDVWQQPLVNNDEVRVNVVGPDETGVFWEGTLVESLRLQASE